MKRNGKFILKMAENTEKYCRQLLYFTCNFFEKTFWYPRLEFVINKKYFKFFSVLLFWNGGGSLLELKEADHAKKRIEFKRNYLLILLRHNLFIFELKIGANSLNKLKISKKFIFKQELKNNKNRMKIQPIVFIKYSVRP